MELMDIRSKGMYLIAIAMNDKTLQIWNECDMVESKVMRDVVVGTVQTVASFGNKFVRDMIIDF